MALHVAYFQPTIIAIDQVPPVEFSKVYTLAAQLHDHPELNDKGNPFSSIRGGQQIQVYPNQLNLDVSWLVTYLEGLCYGYMELASKQSGKDDLTYCKPVVTNIWTIQQGPGDYQELHSHPGGNISGNLYIQVPEFADGSNASDGQVSFRMPHSRDVSKFVLTDTWNASPQSGSVMVFPSHIPHTVYPWKGTGYRTVLGFDARIEPKEECIPPELRNGK